MDTNEIAKALCAFQSEVKDPELNAVTKVKLKNGGQYSFKYATLGEVLKTIRPLLVKYGLSISQTINCHNDKTVLTTTLLHTSGQSIISNMPLPMHTGMQEFGALITYARRYSINAIVGIFAEEDEDANTTESKIDTFNREDIPKNMQESKGGKLVPKAKVKVTPADDDWTISFGKFKGKDMRDVNPNDLGNYVDFLENKAKEEGKEITGVVKGFIDKACNLLEG